MHNVVRFIIPSISTSISPRKQTIKNTRKFLALVTKLKASGISLLDTYSVWDSDHRYWTIDYDGSIHSSFSAAQEQVNLVRSVLSEPVRHVKQLSPTSDKFKLIKSTIDLGLHVCRNYRSRLDLVIHDGYTKSKKELVVACKTEAVCKANDYLREAEHVSSDDGQVEQAKIIDVDPTRFLVQTTLGICHVNDPDVFSQVLTMIGKRLSIKLSPDEVGTRISMPVLNGVSMIIPERAQGSIRSKSRRAVVRRSRATNKPRQNVQPKLEMGVQQ